MTFRVLSGVFAALWLSVVPAFADTAQTLSSAAANYHAGHVLTAEHGLEAALKSATDAKDRWALANLLADICVDSYDYACVSSAWKPLAEAAQDLKAPQITAAKIVFVIDFQHYLENNLDFFRQAPGGLDFSLHVANPLADPVLATRLFLLNAAVWQDAGDFAKARRYIDRAFASFLRIDAGKDLFDTASLLKGLISVTLANHDAMRAIHWSLIADPLIRSGLPSTGFGYADYMGVEAQLIEVLNNTGDGTLTALGQAETAASRLEIAPDLKAGLVSNLIINQAAVYGLRGDKKAMLERMSSAPFHGQREEIIQAGAFSSFDKMFYAAAEIFFDALAGNTPDPRWKPLFQKIPSWRLSADLASEGRIYAKTALALLEAEADPAAARVAIKDAARESLAAFARGRADGQAFPLPSFLDRIAVTVAIASITQGPLAEGDGDLMLGGMELMNRNPRYVISDTLGAMAAQQTDEQRHAIHALLRLQDRQQDWEAQQLRGLVARLAAHQPLASQDFTPQFAAKSFADSVARLSKAVNPPASGFPTLKELQAALDPDEAFIGYFSGMRICVRKTGLWNARMTFDARQMGLDIKLLSAALSSQNAPSDALDSQYPAAAAIRLYHTLFDGLEPCLGGAKQLVYFAPSDVAAVPLSALLRDEPPKAGRGYDLSKAHWLILDYAVSTVTSVRDFLSARSLSRSPKRYSRMFAGIGDPQLQGARGLGDLPQLPETRTEVTSIAKLVKGRSDLRLGDAATEEDFRSLPLDQYQILHFATHGLMQGDIDGLAEAALVFTPQDAKNRFNDDLLTSGDIANLNLAAQLVVLSACNTANFDPTIFTSPLEGLTSAFAAAGAPTTVAALWSVNSETGQKLMTHFYQTLLSPASPTVAVALQQAMIATMREAPSAAFRNPRFWAPFIVLGDGGATITQIRSAPSRDSEVKVSASGGEIMALTQASGGTVSSEIGPTENGRASSLIRKEGGWTLEDKTVGAGALAWAKGEIFAAGYISQAKAKPVLRAISDKGKLLWQKEIDTRFDSAVVAGLIVTGNNVFAVIVPLNETAGRIDFDIVRYDFSGKELSRRSVSRTYPGAMADHIIFAMTSRDDDVYITASYPPGQAGAIRDDFGFSSACFSGRGAHVFELKASDLSDEREKDLPGLSIRALAIGHDEILFSGAVQEGCAFDSETPIFGRLGADMKPAIIWKDDGVFYGQLMGIVPTTDGYAAAANITEPLDVRQFPEDFKLDPGAKYPDPSDTNLAEAVLLRFNRQGEVTEKTFLGNGLPEFAQGLIANRAGEITVYGSDGFNPWLVSLN